MSLQPVRTEPVEPPQKNRILANVLLADGHAAVGKENGKHNHSPSPVARETVRSRGEEGLTVNSPFPRQPARTIPLGLMGLDQLL